MSIKKYDKSIIRETALEKDVPITRFILDAFYKSLRTPITLLGVSPTSISVVESALLVAKRYQSPIMFIASLNQVDIDGGYTGWTPRKFVETVSEKAFKLNYEGPVIIALDHGGPWLKDAHVRQGLDLEEAMEHVMKSIETAITSGYDLLHIDTTVDIHSKRPLNEDVIAKRTLDLIEYAESIRISKGLPRVDYEVGSDRWGVSDPERVNILLKMIRKGLIERGLKETSLLFVVGDLGTRITPKNMLDINVGIKLVEIAKKYGLYVKGHSTDYVKNPESYRKIGIGGANVGPEFADVEYRGIKKLVKLLEKKEMQGKDEFYSILNTIVDLVKKDGRWKKYIPRGINKLESLPSNYREWVIGICSRYIWSNRKVNEMRKKLYKHAESIGVNGHKVIIDEIIKAIRKYTKAFGLEGSTTKLNKVLNRSINKSLASIDVN